MKLDSGTACSSRDLNRYRILQRATNGPSGSGAAAVTNNMYIVWPGIIRSQTVVPIATTGNDAHVVVKNINRAGGGVLAYA